MFHMSYFTAAPQGLDTSVGSLKQSERLLRDADTAWIELVDFRCELSILGETGSSLEGAIEELGAADNVCGVNMADPVSRARVALKSL